METNKILNIGLIGLGGMSNYYRNLISTIETIRIAAICDVNRELVDKLGEEIAIGQERRFTQIEDIIASPDIDAILAVVPNNVHAKIVELCILNQKPVMSEKPFTMNMDEADHLKKLYEESPIPFAIGFIHRYTPSFQYAKQLIDESAIGRIRYFDVKYQQSFGAPFYETPYLWRYDQKISGTGALGDLGAHMIDIARFFVGEFETVSAALMKTFIEKRIDSTSGEEREVDVDDFASFQAELGNHVVGNFVTTRNAVGSANQLEVTIYGDAGTLNMNIERPDEIRLCIKNSDEDPVWKTVEVPESHRNKSVLRDFASLIIDGENSNVPTFSDGYINQTVIESVIQSAAKGQSVKLNREEGK
ncbi:Gfo/Idh/MocA family protein [Lederbergia panacisoli]|uniref:Gfo/Idh/MocA family protein n=1 Tax=Lederbergia panacisoli TaxID=1255251 RepID=UPI00214B5E9C|nr:Gfo/Idh/MocA family oxidoreductase [Lederbergia panacisoli]MCR2822964.1 Gfo/Idh/MocA family oxidoreductase [Lederbergia panacisoli]